MFLSLLFCCSLVYFVLSAPQPVQPPKRQLGSLPDGLVTGTLGALGGALGKTASYDYVVIGGGTGGITMGVRLAQSGASVAIIEAGNYYEIGDVELANTPGGDTFFVGSSPVDSDPLVDWEFVARNQAGANNRPIHYARGKCLGGSSALNFMIYQRGTVGSFQKWADMVDDQSYTFDNVLPYYKKSPQFTPPNTATRLPNASAEYNAGAFSATGGPLQVSYANTAQVFSSWMELALEAIGISETEDFNSGSLMGAQYCSTTIRPSDETRSSSEASFLENAIASQLTNLKVYPNTLAQRILFTKNNTATGVQVQSLGVTYTINATKEVILSAGTFQSPQLLMLSGIGPSSTLNGLGINVISDLPGVGQNMWDHVFFGPSYPVSVDTLTKVVRDPVYLAEQLLLYETPPHTGVLTNPVADFLGWEKVPQNLRDNFTDDAQTALAQFPDDWPELEYLSAAGYFGDFSSPFTDQPLDGKNYATILSALVAPLSRGSVTITSTDASVLPTINPNWLSDPTDQEVAIAAFKRDRQAFNSSAMKPILVGPEYYPGTDVQTDAQILEAIKNSMMTVWHAACTCAMGNSSDPNAVLDSQARVRGVNKLRVVDASSFPILPPGHPQSTIYMLAEKISALMVGTSS